MIVSLRCENFRCFKDTKTIELAPLTLLFGQNNSGKSAIIQALNIPTITAKSEETGVACKLVSTDYDYGSFEDVVYKHDENLKFTLSFGIEYTSTNEKKKQLAILRFTYGYLPKRKEINLSSLIIEDEQGIKLKFLQRKYSDSIRFFIRGFREDLSYLSRLFLSSGLFLGARYPFFETSKRVEKKYGKELGKDIMKKFSEIFSLMHSFRQSLRNIYHLGPLRIPAERTPLYTGSITKDVGVGGNRTLQNYSSLLKRGKMKDRKKTESIKSALCRLGFIKNLETRSIGPRHYEFWTLHTDSLFSANLADSGFGTSQVLPVLFTLYTAPEDSVLLYEQPEIHLHPAAQAELGSVFAEACSPRKRIVIETHSENLILRIQTEMAKGNLKPEDVIVYYIQPKKDGHRVINLPLNEKGEFLKKWPTGFFEEGYKESLKLTKARLSK